MKIEITDQNNWIALTFHLSIIKGFILIFSLSIITTSASGSQDTRKITAGAKYRASSLHQLLLGRDYRNLWTTPIDVEVLNLSSFAGGLLPVRRVGGMQTLGLALKGADGRSYSFRAVDKDPTTFLPESFAGTLAAQLIQDQTAAAHPASAVIVPKIAEAAGVLHNEPRLVVMPDDPALGEFREAFAGALGTIEEYPTPASHNHPGTFGAIEILSSIDMWKRLDAGPEDRIDAYAYLRARLLDILLGDWDRHRMQWRWAKIPGKLRWQPVPEDRDQVFASYKGLILEWVRIRNPQLVTFKKKFPPLEGLTWNGRDVDRWILPELEKSTWIEIATDLKKRITDAVIDAALKSMPPEYYKLSGEAIASILKHRRDLLVEIAGKFYHHLAGQVDVFATNKAEKVEIRRLGKGNLEILLSLSSAAKSDTIPYFQRRFHPEETKEVRIYLQGGDDHVIATGHPLGGITVRVIGGAGDDRVDDLEGGGLRFYDFVGNNRIRPGSGTRFNQRKYIAPVINPKTPWIRPRDWGSRTAPRILPGFNTDYGLFLGGGLISRNFGFRKYPYANSYIIRGGYAAGARKLRCEYQGEHRYANSSFFSSLMGLASGIEILRFYGFGNTTTACHPDDFYKIRQNQFILLPALHWLLWDETELSLGPEFKLAKTDLKTDTQISRLMPYGAENFIQMGLKLRFKFATGQQDQPFVPLLRFQAEGALFPKLWDVKSPFGSIQSQVAVNFRLAPFLTLASRVGGKKVFGTYPFHEAATIGGVETVRGFRKDRFAGDASLFGNLELRIILGKALLFLPGEYGILVLGDVGRVFLSGEDSSQWHSAAGGGFFFSVLDISTTFSVTAATCKERTSVYFRAGFAF